MAKKIDGELVVANIAKIQKFLDSNEARIAKRMPVGVRSTLVTKSLTAAMRADIKVAACSPASLITCFEQMVATGLDIGKGMMGKAYIIPYGGEAQFQIGYKGIKELVKRSGEGRVVTDYAVEGDTFEYRGKYTEPYLVECDDPMRHAKKLLFAWAMYQPNDGSRVLVERWTRERCIGHRDHYSKGYIASFNKKEHSWHIDSPNFPVMCMKSPMFYLAGRGDLPLSPDVRTLVQASEEFNADLVAVPAAQITQQPMPPAEPESYPSLDIPDDTNQSPPNDEPEPAEEETPEETPTPDSEEEFDLNANVVKALKLCRTLKACDETCETFKKAWGVDHHEDIVRIVEERKTLLRGGKKRSPATSAEPSDAELT